SYSSDVPVGFYTQVLGLGARPEDVTFTGERGVHCDQSDDETSGRYPGVYNKFWRGAENFANRPSSSRMAWAVSQAAPLRRVLVDGDLELGTGFDKKMLDGFSAGGGSGGFLGNVRILGRLNFMLQQQWLVRNSEMENTTFYNDPVRSANFVFVGTHGAPPQTDACTDAGSQLENPKPQQLVVKTAPLTIEKPYITIRPSGRYDMIIPKAKSQTAGVQWDSEVSDVHTDGFDKVFVATPNVSVRVINAKLAAGLHVVLSPGIYHLSEPIRLGYHALFQAMGKRAGSPYQVLLGLGLATLVPTQGTAAIEALNSFCSVRTNVEFLFCFYVPGHPRSNIGLGSLFASSSSAPPASFASSFASSSSAPPIPVTGAPRPGDAMHALPQKLADLREEIGASVSRRFLEQRLGLEKQLKDSLENATEAGFQKARDQLEPQILALGTRLDAELAHVRDKVSTNSAISQQVTDALRLQMEKQEKDLLARFIGVKSELPALGARLKSAEEMVQKLRSTPAELRTEMSSFLEQINGSMERLRLQISDLAQRSKETQAGLSRETAEASQATSLRMDALVAKVEQSSKKAASLSSQVEERLQAQIAELNKQLDTVQHLSNASGPESCHDSSSHQLPEPDDSTFVTAAFAEGWDHQQEEHRSDQAQALIDMQAELQALRTEVAASLDAFNRSGEALAQGVQEAWIAQQLAFTASQEAAAAESQRLQESSTSVLSVQVEVGSLRACMRLTEQAACEAQQAAKSGAEEAAREARQMAAGEADRRLARALQLLKAERCADMAAQAEREQTRGEEACSQLSCSIASCRQECEAAAETVVSRLLHVYVDSGRASSGMSIAEPAGRLAATCSELRLQFAEAREAWDQGQAALRTELSGYVTLEEAAQGAAAAAKTNSEILMRLTHVDATFDRHRKEFERMGRSSREVFEHCDSHDARCDQLSEELTLTKTATTSLAQGVLKALQVLGLLREELGAEVLPPRACDGKVPAHCAHWGIEVLDLLEWEKAGQSLASRVEKQWSRRKDQDAATVMSLVERKAEDKEFRSMATAFRRIAGAGGPLPSPSMRAAHLQISEEGGSTHTAYQAACACQRKTSTSLNAALRVRAKGEHAVPRLSAVFLQVEDVCGVRVAGLLLQAGHVHSDVLLRWGGRDVGGGSCESNDPGLLADVFARVGGPDTEAVSTAVMVEVNADDSVLDNLWLWRADHCEGQADNNRCPPRNCDNALIVNGDRVTAYGLCAEHTQQDVVVWNGEDGASYFFQAELDSFAKMPYDNTSDYGPNVCGYRVNALAHRAWGIGVYAFFVQSGVVVPAGILVRHSATLDGFICPFKWDLNAAWWDHGESTILKAGLARNQQASQLLQLVVQKYGDRSPVITGCTF
ncbi:unnamed protein product, partial [Polarella glacialis]